MDKPANPTDAVSALVCALYDIVHELEELFPGRRFTPDGHLVGSIGEVIAARRYGLTLRRASFTGCDATAPDGRDVEIKATQGDRVALRCRPSHLLVLRLDAKGGAAEVYNGPGEIVWPHVSRQQTNGQSAISLSRLRALMASVPPTSRLPIVNP
jgi:hypothetical protein